MSLTNEAPVTSGASLGEADVPKGMDLQAAFADVDAPKDDVEVEKPSTDLGKEVSDETLTESAPATEDTPKEPADEVVTETPSETVKIPAAHIRTLKAYGYSDDEITELSKSPNALKVTSKLHETRNAEMAKWADLGRKQKQSATVQPPVSTPAKPAEQSALKPIDIESLKKTYGDEALIHQLTPVNQAIEQLNKMFPVVQAYQEQQQKSAAESFTRQIDGFFNAKDMKDFNTHYGVDSTKMSADQESNRIKVLEHADALMYGARVQGREMTTDEALSLAHELTTAGLSQTKARSEIAAQLKAREKSMTLKPAGRKGDLPVAKDNKEIRSRVKSGLAKAFG